jgi:Fe2+ or Zn2+ uptake regulation protein
MTEHEYKKLIIPCKVCGREFEFKCPIEIYEAAAAAAEGLPVEFAGACPDCRGGRSVAVAPGRARHPYAGT